MFSKFKQKLESAFDFFSKIFSKDFINLNKDPDLKGSETVSFNGTDQDEIILGVRRAENSIAGNGGDDIVIGRKESDTLFGGLGDDEVFGRAGDDTVFGGRGFDKVFGGKGNDILDGGTEDDMLSGGRGADTFRFNDRLIDDGTAGVDTIIDYNFNAGDRIEFFNLDGIENVFVEQDGGDVNISVDVDGNGTADVLVAIVEDSLDSDVQSGIIGIASEDVLIV